MQVAPPVQGPQSTGRSEDLGLLSWPRNEAIGSVQPGDPPTSLELRTDVLSSCSMSALKELCRLLNVVASRSEPPGRCVASSLEADLGLPLET